MERMRHSDYRRLLDFIAGLQESVALADFGRHIVRLTSDLLPSVTIAFDQIQETSGYYSIDHNVALDRSEMARMQARLCQVYQQNPIYDYIQGGGRGPVVDIEELMPIKKLHRTDFYQDIFRPYGIEHQLNVLSSREGWINTLTINSDRAINDRVKTILSLASRHIQLAHRNACLMERIVIASGIANESNFTVRESEVLFWMREGKRNAEIGIILGCATRTIDKHVENILRKTGTETRTAAVKFGP